MRTARSEDELLGIEVELDPERGYRISWSPAFSAGPVTIYGGPDPAHIGGRRPLARAACPGVTVPAGAPGGRMYFRLEREQGAGIVVAQRDVPLEGAINLRDLGGYAAADGKRVRWGRLFRSGHLSHLSGAGIAGFARLGVRTVCDFRMAEERAAEALDLPDNPTVEVLGITPGVGDRFFFHRLFETAPDPQPVLEAMHVLMRDLALNGTPRLKRLFAILLEGPPGAVLLNCSAGKERTGLAAALVLAALGVPRATIVHDFLLSARYFPIEAEIPRVLTKYAVRDTGEFGRRLIMPLLETRESYLQSAFAAIDERYGCVEGLLETLYGLGPAALGRLRDHYTI